MMKFVAVFVTVFNGAEAPVHDDDGPNEFPNYRACVLHAIRRAPEMQAIIADQVPGYDGKVTWRCEPIR